jgi:hypothetical protein
MFVLPVKGDKIETKDGVTFTALSFTNYREKGPAVFVEHTAGVPSDAVYFFDILKINDKAVEYIPGSKVFKTAGEIRRKFQLPQVGDTVTFKDKEGRGVMKVKGLKLHKRGELAKGLFVVGEGDEDDERKTVRIAHVIDIERDIGNDLFSRDRFLSYYSDYKGS